MSLFKIEYLDKPIGGAVVEFRFLAVLDLATAACVAKLGLGDASARRGAQIYRVRDETGLIVATGPAVCAARS